MQKIVISTLAAVLACSSFVAVSGPAMAQDYDWRRHYDRRPPPPPPRRYHDHHNGNAIAGGLAAGVIGGLIGGAIVNGSGPRYVEPPPPPPPRCWFEDRRVQNTYDPGWHMESIRVCR